MYERAVSGSECPFPEPFFENEAVDKEVDSPQRKGRVCAGNPRRVSCAIEILSFQNFYEVLKTCSAGRKDFFDTLRQRETAAFSDILGGIVMKLTWLGHACFLLEEDGYRIVLDPYTCLLYTSPSPRDKRQSRMPSSA